MGNCEYLHTHISILVHSEHIFKTIILFVATLRSCAIYAFDSDWVICAFKSHDNYYDNMYPFVVKSNNTEEKR